MLPYYYFSNVMFFFYYYKVVCNKIPQFIILMKLDNFTFKINPMFEYSDVTQKQLMMRHTMTLLQKEL